MSKQKRDVFFNGRKHENGKTIDRGSVGVRGPQAAEELKTLIEIKRATAGLVTIRATLLNP
jgi:hypothetical protein